MITANRCLYTFVCTLLVVMALAGQARAVSQLKYNAPSPPIDLKDLDGNRITVESLKGRPAILIFGELYNRNTILALKELEEVYKAEKLVREKLPIYLIVAQDVEADDLRKARTEKKVQVTVLHDRSRKAFADYAVLVLPCAVVVDAKWRVCVTVSGYPLAFGDIMTDAIKLALGKITRKQFESLRKATTKPAVSDSKLKARRLAGLAGQLFRRGHTELALERYEEALKLDPDYPSARVGLARSLIRLDRLGDAAKLLQKTLTSDKRNVDANLAMAYVEILRGGKEVESARKRLERVLLLSPHIAEAHYLMGLVHEKQEHTDKALAEFKKAAEIFLEMKRTPTGDKS